MSKMFYHVMQDNAGNLLFDVSGTMRIAGTGTAATIYGDEALTIPIANPMTNHPSFGSFKCFLGVGDYDFYMAKAGYTFETLTGVQGSGTMADQNADAVAIQGGTAIFSSAGITTLGIGGIGPVAGHQIFVRHAKGTSQHGITVQPTDSDSGGGSAVLFFNAAGTGVGNINTSVSATFYNTTSDARLKCNASALTGALDLMQALSPVSFLWKADGSPGVGFLAQDVAAVVPGVVSGDPEAVDAAGQVVPMQMDLSKLVPYLVGAIKSLTARLAVLEDAMGV
jgi:hypothetical protein